MVIVKDKDTKKIEFRGSRTLFRSPRSSSIPRRASLSGDSSASRYSSLSSCSSPTARAF